MYVCITQSLFNMLHSVVVVSNKIYLIYIFNVNLIWLLIIGKIVLNNRVLYVYIHTYVYIHIYTYVCTDADNNIMSYFKNNK